MPKGIWVIVQSRKGAKCEHGLDFPSFRSRIVVEIHGIPDRRKRRLVGVDVVGKRRWSGGSGAVEIESGDGNGGFEDGWEIGGRWWRRRKWEGN